MVSSPLRAGQPERQVEMGSVLVLETDGALRQKLLLGLRAQGIDAEGVSAVAGLGRVLSSVGGADVEAVVVGSGTAAVAEVVATMSHTDLPLQGAGSSLGASGATLLIPAVVVLIEGNSDALAAGLRAIRDGATDFVPGSSGAEGVAWALRKVQARRAACAPRPEERRGQTPAVGRTEPLPARSSPSATTPVLVGATPKIAAVLTLVRRLAGVKAAVLVGGESGTGKELIAQALHDQSPWRAGPFVAVNCGAIPAGLIESELFGHVRGAFTDAVRDKQGLFQAAHGGTLFLDEIADLPLALQPKLLRALQEGVVRRVGDCADTRVEVRVVAATARELTAEVAAHRFREDLYYRIAGVTIQIPPLRERIADLPLLADHFLARARERLGVRVGEIDPEAMRVLAAHSWPGNVRELENTIERAAVLCADGRIDVASLPERMVPRPAPDSNGPFPGSSPPPALGLPEIEREQGALSIKEAARRSEQDLIRRALTITAGNRTRAAELLEISHRALLYKIKEYKILVPRRGPQEAKE